MRAPSHGADRYVRVAIRYAFPPVPSSISKAPAPTQAHLGQLGAYPQSSCVAAQRFPAIGHDSLHNL
jgi:hypothetical protein